MLHAEAQNDGGHVTLRFTGRANGLCVLLRNVHAVSDLHGATAVPDPLGTRLTVNDVQTPVTFTMQA